MTLKIMISRLVLRFLVLSLGYVKLIISKVINWRSEKGWLYITVCRLSDRIMEGNMKSQGSNNSKTIFMTILIGEELLNTICC